MSQLRQGDLYLFQTLDGGNIEIVNGEPVMDGGFESATYLSLFGADSSTHWMNEYQSESEKMTGQFYNFIKSNPKTVLNINKAQELAKLDLQWFINDGIADTINAEITSSSVNRIELVVEILLNGETISSNEYKINWDYMRNDLASERV